MTTVTNNCVYTHNDLFTPALWFHSHTERSSTKNVCVHVRMHKGVHTRTLLERGSLCESLQQLVGRGSVQPTQQCTAEQLRTATLILTCFDLRLSMLKI